MHLDDDQPQSVAEPSDALPAIDTSEIVADPKEPSKVIVVGHDDSDFSPSRIHGIRLPFLKHPELFCLMNADDPRVKTHEQILVIDDLPAELKRNLLETNVPKVKFMALDDVSPNIRRGKGERKRNRKDRWC